MRASASIPTHQTVKFDGEANFHHSTEPAALQAIARVARITDIVLATTGGLAAFNERAFGVSASVGAEKSGPTPVPNGWVHELEMKLNALHSAVVAMQDTATRTCEIG